MEINKLSENERKYTFKQSSQISGQTGLVGHFTCKPDFENVIFNTYRDDLATDVFRKRLSNVLVFLKSTNTSNSIRIDDENNSFLVRIDDDEVSCYCYETKWLDSHIKEAQKGIRFIDSRYNEQFRIRDGGTIKITFPDGRTTDKTCRFIDAYHVEIGNIYHICEFAERMERNGNKVEPNPGDVIALDTKKKTRGKER